MAKSLQSDETSAILNAVSGEVVLPKVSRKYVLGLVATALAVLMLPMLYMASIALVPGILFAAYRHADQFAVGWNPVVRYSVLAAISLFGVAFLLGLLKPFLASVGAVKRFRILRPGAEPVLYAYVNRLCDVIGAPRPLEIHVNCDLNAGAEFRCGWLNVFGTRKMSLHLGLPLVAGLSLEQLTGVLAHELGHFTQRTAMWLETMVRRTNLWFLRAARERDSIDEWIDRQCRARGPMALVCYPAQSIIWLARRLFHGLATAGMTISCSMSREMEYNADRCQVRVVGNRAFTSTLRRLRELTIAHQISFRDVVAFYQEGRLPDDMIALSVANIGFITPEVKKKLIRMMRDETTGAFDSHPSDQDRIAAAIKDGSQGIFQTGSLSSAQPATILFCQFAEISKSMTAQFYQDAFTGNIASGMLHPVEKLLARQSVQIDAAKALKRYFQADLPRLRPLPIAAQSMDPPENPREVALALKASRIRMIEELVNYKRLTPGYATAVETFSQTVAAQELSLAKIEFIPAEFQLKDASADAIAAKLSRSREGVATLAGKLLPFETEAGNRLSFALQLLHLPSVMGKIPQGDELWFQISELLPAAQFVNQLIGELPTLRIAIRRLGVLNERSQVARSNDRVKELIASHLKSVRANLNSIRKEMGNHLYPFDHADAKMTVREYALPHIPDESDLKGILVATEQMQSRLISIQTRLFARLAQAAEKVEEAIGMPPLPEPTADEAD